MQDKHQFNGLFLKTIWVSWHQKVKLIWILVQQQMMGWQWHQTMWWQWHQLDHMQVICTSLQTTMPAPHHSTV